ncbi:MAG: helix-turn-helix domain-containing protein [Microgenomates group bacterium]
MNKQILSTQLEQFGLDEIEVQIYLNLLETGAKTPLDLSRETNINRTKIYRYLDRLKAKKLVEEVNSGRGMHLKASDPENLQILLLEKEHQITSQKELLPGLLQELTKIPNTQQSFFEMKQYHGDDGLKQMLWNWSSAKKEILLYGYQTMNEIVGRKFAEMLREEQVKKKITVYEIEEEIDQGNFTGKFTYTDVQNWGKYYTPRYVDPKLLKIRQYTGIYNNTVCIMNWDHGVKVGVEIINEVYASMQKQLFWNTWNQIGEKPIHSKK